MFVLAVVVSVSVQRTIASSYYLAQVLVSTEAVFLEGPGIQTFQHVLLHVDASHPEVGWRVVTVEVIVVVLCT